MAILCSSSIRIKQGWEEKAIGKRGKKPHDMVQNVLTAQVGGQSIHGLGGYNLSL